MKKPTIVQRDRVVAGLDEEWNELILLAAELGPEDWSRPTDCPGWSVKDQFAHVIGTEAMLLGRPAPDLKVPPGLEHVTNDVGRINEAWIMTYRPRSGSEVVSDLAEVVTERRRALSGMDQFDFDELSWTPSGQDTYGRFMRIRVFDQWMHEQDVREACGRPGHLEGLASQLALEEIGAVLGYIIGKQAQVPAGRSVRFVLEGPVAGSFDVQVTDRARVVDRLPGQPTVTLTMPGATFCRVAGGRRAWTDERVKSATAIEGDAKLADQVMSNLAFTI